MPTAQKLRSLSGGHAGLGSVSPSCPPLSHVSLFLLLSAFIHIFGYIGKLDPSLAGQRRRKPHICPAIFCMPKLVVCCALRE